MYEQLNLMTFQPLTSGASDFRAKTSQYTGMIFVPAVKERLRSVDIEYYARKIK